MTWITTEQADLLARFRLAQDSLLFQAADLSLASLGQMVETNAIDIAPSYQRRHRWPAEKQSALIESFLLNIPVPPIYLAEDETGRYSVVDGKQRLTAIADFMTERLRLKNLESLVEAEGYCFSDFPDEVRNTLSIRPFLRVITLLRKSSPLLKYEVFIRLNRGGESMEPQELRNVAFRGPLNELIMNLSTNPFLGRQLKIKDDSSSAFKLMADVELVLRFLTLREHWETFSGSLRMAMDRFMAENAHASKEKLDNYSKRFQRALSGCESLWGAHAFQRPAPNDGWRDQLLNGVYDAQMVAVDQLSDADLASLSAKSEQVQDSMRHLFEVRDFDRAAREATNTPSRVKYRINEVIKQLRALV